MTEEEEREEAKGARGAHLQELTGYTAHLGCWGPQASWGWPPSEVLRLRVRPPPACHPRPP